MSALSALDRLSETLDAATGADPDIDLQIAQAFHIELRDFSGSAISARNLVSQLLPGADFKVGYDVCGIFPSATIRTAQGPCTAVAPTVPIAILRALKNALKACAAVETRRS